MRKFNKSSKVAVFAAFIVLFTLGATWQIAALAAGPETVNLLSANNFAILSKTGITNTGSHTTAITGNIGSSPITAAAMNNVFCGEITGTIYGVNAAYVGSGNQTCFAGNPPLSNKTLVDNAVLDMGTAYANIAGRTNPTATELGAGNIGGMTLAPGLYKWSTDVTIPTSVTLSGGANDVWMFQVAGNLSIASGGSVPAGIKIVLAGGANASNIFWQVGGGTGATLGTYSTFNGTILSAKQIIMQTGAVLNGRALAKTQVTLDNSTVNVPSTTTTKGRIKVIKETVGGNSTFHFTGGLGSFSISTNNQVGSKTFSNLNAGQSYSVNETPLNNWSITSNNCQNVAVVANQTTSCIIVNTRNQEPPLNNGKIFGKKFEDRDGDGNRDTNENHYLQG